MSDDGFLAAIIAIGFVMVVYVAVLCSIIYFAFWCARHFGVIG